MTQGGYQVIMLRRSGAFLRFLYFTESPPPSFKVRGLQMTMNLALV